MSSSLEKKIKSLFPSIKQNINIAPLTTFGIGGNVSFYRRVKSNGEFLKSVKLAVKNKIPFLIMAGGSNVIFPDSRLKKLVIHYQTGSSAKNQVKVSDQIIECQAGLDLAELIQTSIKNNLAGLETLSGIPGTVGGAIVGNAGAYGHSLAEVIKSVRIFDGQKVRQISRADCRFAYRDSIFKHQPWFVLSATFKFTKGDSNDLKKISKNIIKLRRKKYKPALRCPGSFFKNVLVTEVSPKALQKIDQSKIIQGKIPAGFLLEEVGARGEMLGGISIASFHGNLLINNGQGTYKEVRNMANNLKQLVKKRFGITLEEEVRYML